MINLISSLLLILSLISLSSSSSSSSDISPSSSDTTTKFNFKLSPNYHTPNQDPTQILNSLASSTIYRANHLKSLPPTKSKLSPKSFGAYTISLAFGTPPQASAPLVFDTGSALVWLPCTSSYLCSRCAFPNVDPARLPRFIPKNSSTSRLVGCRNPMCAWVFGSGPACNGPTNSTCPAYVIQYGSGSTAGLLLSDNLDLPGGVVVPGFLVGCSILSVRQPAGIAGFGRGPQSLPSQLKLSKFTHCLVSHRFDDTPVSSDLVLYKNDEKTGGAISYTQFQKNPGKPGSAFQEYYYVLLRKVIVGGKSAKIPYVYLQPGSDGRGGTIIDSGTTFSYMERPVHQAVAGQIAKQMGRYTRAFGVENRTGLMPCFDVSKEKSVVFPELVFQFKGGATMELPLPNYFSIVGGSAVCFTVVTDGGARPGLSGGPAIILGNYQMMNFHVEYDLKNGRFGFRKQSCIG